MKVVTNSWVVISRGFERYVTELALDHTEPRRVGEHTPSIGRLVAWEWQSSASTSSGFSWRTHPDGAEKVGFHARNQKS